MMKLTEPVEEAQIQETHLLSRGEGSGGTSEGGEDSELHLGGGLRKQSGDDSILLVEQVEI